MCGAARKAGEQLDALGWLSCGGAAVRLGGAEREELAATLRVEHQRQAEVRVLGGVLVGGQAQDAALQRRFHGRDDVALQVLAGAEGVAGEFQVARPAVAGERTSVGWGTSVSVRVDLGGRRLIKTQKRET